MPNIRHRLSIDAPPERVHHLAATREGIQRRWTGHPVAGDDEIGGRFEVYFRAGDPGGGVSVPAGLVRDRRRRGDPRTQGPTVR